MKKNLVLVSANGGIGSAVAGALLNRGYSVVATVSRPEKIASFRRAFPGIEQLLALDLSDAVRTREVLGAVIAGMERLDGAVVRGAISPFAPAETMPMEMFRSADDGRLCRLEVCARRPDGCDAAGRQRTGDRDHPASAGHHGHARAAAQPQ